MNHKPPSNRPSTAFIDKQMISNVEAAMLDAFLKRNPGSTPTAAQLSSFASGLSRSEVLQIAREYPGNASLLVNMRNDDDVLRWVDALK